MRGSGQGIRGYVAEECETRDWYCGRDCVGGGTGSGVGVVGGAWRCLELGRRRVRCVEEDRVLDKRTCGSVL